MKLAIRPLLLTCAILWGGTVLLCGLANMQWPPYGEGFLQLIDSIYPGYHADGSIRNVIVGALYGMVDGAVGGLVFGLLYNFLTSKCCCHGECSTEQK